MTDVATLLIVEDDDNLRLTLSDILQGEGYRVLSAATLAQAETLYSQASMIVLDLMLPDGDGYSWCQKLREREIYTPVLMLTARSLEDDLVKGFDAGADDYLVKPYRLSELLVRVKALLKRDGNRAPASDVFQVNDFTLDRSARTATDTAGNSLELTPKEFDIFLYFWDHPHRAISREQLLERVWGQVVVDPRTVDNFISSLKKKLRLSSNNRVTIETVRGVGYRLER